MKNKIIRLFPLKRYLIEPSGLLKNPLNRAVQLPPVRNFSGSYEREFILGADLSGVDGTCSCLPRTRSFRWGNFCGPKSRDVRRGAATNPVLQVDFVTSVFFQNGFAFFLWGCSRQGLDLKNFPPQHPGIWFPTVEINGPELDEQIVMVWRCFKWHGGKD